jgi:hypothetical protein
MATTISAAFVPAIATASNAILSASLNTDKTAVIMPIKAAIIATTTPIRGNGWVFSAPICLAGLLS